MDAKTLEALKASIAKWERNAEAETPDEYLTGPDECALCKLFFGKDCRGCPVSTKTSQPCCTGSPYDQAWGAYDAWCSSPHNENLTADAHGAARAEVTFLKSLLPTEG